VDLRQQLKGGGSYGERSSGKTIFGAKRKYLGDGPDVVHKGYKKELNFPMMGPDGNVSERNSDRGIKTGKEPLYRRWKTQGYSNQDLRDRMMR